MIWISQDLPRRIGFSLHKWYNSAIWKLCTDDNLCADHIAITLLKWGIWLLSDWRSMQNLQEVHEAWKVATTIRMEKVATKTCCLVHNPELRRIFGISANHVGIEAFVKNLIQCLGANAEATASQNDFCDQKIKTAIENWETADSAIEIEPLDHAAGMWFSYTIPIHEADVYQQNSCRSCITVSCFSHCTWIASRSFRQFQQFGVTLHSNTFQLALFPQRNCMFPQWRIHCIKCIFAFACFTLIRHPM